MFLIATITGDVTYIPANAAASALTQGLNPQSVRTSMSSVEITGSEF